MRIIKLTNINDINRKQLKKLFLNYPFKNFQQKIQEINARRLSDFFTEEIILKIKNKTTFYFKVEDGGNLMALFSVEPLKKHSEIYGKNMFQISSYLNYKNSKICFNLFWKKFQEIISKRDIKYLSCRLDVNDCQNTAILTAKGFCYAGVSMKLMLSLDKFPLPSIYEMNGISINLADSNDMPEILKIVREHKHNHYFCDIWLDKEKTKEVFSEWVRGFMKKNNAGIYVLKNVDGKLLGFVSYLEPISFNKALNKKIVALDFIAISKKFQNKNLGSLLLGSFLTRIYSRFDIVELRVAADNYPALNFYKKFGFQIIGGDIWLSYQSE